MDGRIQLKINLLTRIPALEWSTWATNEMVYLSYKNIRQKILQNKEMHTIHFLEHSIVKLCVACIYSNIYVAVVCMKLYILTFTEIND